TEAQLAPYFIGATAARVLTFLEGQDRRAAEAECQRGLTLVPGDPSLLMMLSGTQSRLGRYREALTVLEPAPQAKEPVLKAAIENNQAFALLMLNLGAERDDAAVARADALSKAAYEAFPCLLFLRSTRALVLAATDRADEALALLDYCHFQTA